MAADPAVRNSVAVADPDAPSHCLKPQEDGSLNVNTTVVLDAVDIAVANAVNPTIVEGAVTPLSTDLSGNLRTAPLPYPIGATPITAASGNKANADAVATLAKAASKTTYITGFEVTGSGATVGLPVIVTVVGVVTGTLSYIYTAAVGALLPNQPLVVEFPYSIPSSAVNTDIVVTCPALGAGSTNNAVVAHGFRL